MKFVAIPNWQDRVSPVFDVAEHVLVVELVQGRENARRIVELGKSHPPQRAAHLSSLGICGAISSPLEDLVTAGGIKVISHVCGDVEVVLQAFGKRILGEERYAMPGCCGLRLRQQRRGQGNRNRSNH